MPHADEVAYLFFPLAMKPTALWSSLSDFRESIANRCPLVSPSNKYPGLQAAPTTQLETEFRNIISLKQRTYLVA